MFGLGATELIVILLIVILLFGATKLPQIGKGVGEAIRNFKGAIGGDDEAKKNVENKEQPKEDKKA
jgi:sec-independent protein translocase protein TatA